VKITCKDAVLFLKKRGLSTTAESIALAMTHAGCATTSRAVATALRSAVNDGRVTITFRRGRGFYRFVRLTPKEIKS